MALLIVAIILLVEFICGTIENYKCLSKPRGYLWGHEVRYDRNSNMYMHGEKVVKQFDYKLHDTVYVGSRTGTVYNDPKGRHNRKVESENRIKKEQYTKLGYLAYSKWICPYESTVSIFIPCGKDRPHYETTEISTDKHIVKLAGNVNYDGKYYKFYEGEDEGVEITREEFNKLDIGTGADHFTESWKLTREQRIELQEKREAEEKRLRELEESGENNENK